ncbi:T-cell surface glycoprotein CD5 [Cebidichthys violaceus]|uniref:T-cell surface glycoprotein CD5 n=1 Tax=Cebidichthys violaceus TaxID=271503 RepID=UPI0035CA9AB3
MDLRTVVTFSALLLIVAGSDQTSAPHNIQSPNQTTNTSRDYSSPNTTPTTTAAPTSNPISSAPALGLLTITWMSKCEGEVTLILSNSSMAVCHGSEPKIQSLLRNVCKNQEGCKDTLHWDKGIAKLNGCDITKSGAVKKPWCESLRVQCTVEEVLRDVQGQLQAYKVVTALLCCVLLVLLLIRFTRPTFKALQKRVSQKRQNRWIGPTQSHSVSYHRGKTAVKNNDEEKRLSYPALERLAVSDSREPSSNRNSDYNF